VDLRIGRVARDALYNMLLAEVAAIGDISISLMADEACSAKRLRKRYEQDLRLLDDLGWESSPPTDCFHLSMQPSSLRATLARLYWSSNATLAHSTELDQQALEHAAEAQIACSELLSQLDEANEPNPDISLTLSKSTAQALLKQTGVTTDDDGYWHRPTGQHTKDLAKALNYGLTQLAHQSANQ
jgi:hypothetical protein